MSTSQIALPLLIAVVAALVRSVTAEAVVANVSDTSGARAELGELMVEAVDGSMGSPLAVRVRIAPRSLLEEDQVVLARDGIARLSLEAGRYRVIVTHGPEWSVSEHEIDVAAGQPTKVAAALTRLIDGSAFTACELHTHTAESPDSKISLEQRVASLLAEDLQFAVITDHNQVTDASERLEAAGIGTLPGVEVTTWAPEFGHFNVFPRLQAPRFQHTSPLELLREVRSDGATFIQINHPRLERHIGYFELGRYVRELGRAASDFPLTFDAIEVWNGYDLTSSGRRDEIFHDWLALAARGQRISATGGSDAHATSRPPYVGYPRTYVHVPRAHARDSGTILAALKRGQSFVSNGPLLDVRLLGKRAGDTVVVSGSKREIALQVRLESPAWMGPFELEVWLGARRVALRQLPAAAVGALAHKATVRFDVAVGEERSIVVAARGGASMRSLLGRDAKPHAFSNPIWIEGS